MATKLLAEASIRNSAAHDLAAVFDDLVRCETRLYTALDQALRAEHGLATSQYEFLRFVAARERPRVVDAAEYFAVGVGAASKGADRLERAGWVRRVPNPADRRSLLLELTESGTAILRAAEVTFTGRLAALLEPDLDPATAAVVGAVLHRLRSRLEQSGAGTPAGCAPRPCRRAIPMRAASPDPASGPAAYRRSMEPDLQALADRLEIADTIGRLSRHMDTRNWDGFGSILDETVTYTFKNDDGSATVSTSSWQELVGHWSDDLDAMRHTQHIYSGISVVLDGDNATASYAETGVLQRDMPLGDTTWSFGTMMDADFSRTAAGWRIRALTVTPTWGSGNIGVLGDWKPPTDSSDQAQ